MRKKDVWLSFLILELVVCIAGDTVYQTGELVWVVTC